MADKSASQELEVDDVNYHRALNFSKIYDLQVAVGLVKKKTILGSKTPQRCRFCGGVSPDVKFNIPHVLPQFMGNKKLISSFECKTCNDQFSLYEDSFAKYIGINRAAEPGRKGPKFKNIKTGLELFQEEDGHLKLIMLEGSQEVNIDDNAKQIVITTSRQTYIPIHIPKVLLKVGFCLLSEDEIAVYEQLRRFLADSSLDSKYKDNQLLNIMAYMIPGPPYFKHPTAMLFQKREDCKEVLTFEKILVLQYGHYQYQIGLVLGDNDTWLYGKEAQIPVYPLLIHSRYFDANGPYSFGHLNLTSAEREVDQPHSITFNFGSSEFLKS